MNDELRSLIIEKSRDAFGTELFLVNKSNLIQAIKLLKTNFETRFDMLLSITAVDCIENFELFYNLYSNKLEQSILLKVKLEKLCPQIQTLTELYSAANWHERECYDLMGIDFLGHPNLERLLMPKGWIGHPLRKDYKLEDERLSWNNR